MHVRLQIAEVARGVGPSFGYAQENQPVALQGRDVARIVVVVRGIGFPLSEGAPGLVDLLDHAVIFVVMILVIGEATAPDHYYSMVSIFAAGIISFS